MNGVVDPPHPEPAPVERTRALAIFTALLAVAVSLTPLWAADPVGVAGVCLLAGAAAELFQGFRRRTVAAQRDAWLSGAYTLVLGLLILNASWLAATALTLFVAVPFAVDAVRYVGLAVRQIADGKSLRHAAGSAVWNLAVALAVLLLGRYAANWMVGLAAGLRLAATTLNLAAGPVYSEHDADESVIADIGLDRPERLVETGARLQQTEENRVAPIRAGSRRSWSCCWRFTSAAWDSTDRH